MKAAKVFLLAGLTGVITVNRCFGQTWTQTIAPNSNWFCVACSSDGTKLAAATDIGVSNLGGIWISTNGGCAWTQTGAPGLDWSFICLSADGNKLVAMDNYHSIIYHSADLGTTWATNSVPNNGVPYSWYQIAISADGNKLFASANGYIYISADLGVTWVSNSIPPIGYTAVSVASSANGTKLVAAANYPGQIFMSTNMGVTWTLVNFPWDVTLDSIACSADGSTWVVGGGAAGDGSGIFVTTDSGATWISNGVPALGHVYWSSVASSADGSTLVGVATSQNLDSKGASLIFTSTNFGMTWIQADAPVKAWRGVASSADGCRLVGLAGNWSVIIPPYPGSIYTAQIMPAPRVNITPLAGEFTLSWLVPSTNFVLQSSADLSSWMDLTNQPVLNLTKLQNEISLPLSGGNGGFYRLKTP